MSNYIERGRTALKNNQETRILCGEIFTTAVDLLRKKGELGKVGFLRKGKIIQHTVNSDIPEVPVEIWSSGSSPEKAKQIYMRIAGVGTVRVEKKVSKGEEKYKGEKRRIGGTYYWDIDVDDAFGYLVALRDVKREIENPRKPRHPV